MNTILCIARITWLGFLRRKDAYVVGILLAGIVAALAFLDIMGMGAILGYVKDLGFGITWLFAWFICVLTAAREIPAEEARGTVFAMLARPVSRDQLVIGKWLGCVSATALATVVFYAVVVLVVRIKGGGTDTRVLIQAVLLHTCALMIISAVAIAFSTRMSADASTALALVTTLGLYVLMPRIPLFIAHESGWRQGVWLGMYNLLPHLEFFDMRKRLVHDYGPIPWDTLTGIMLYGIITAALILVLACLAYRHKRLTRSTTAIL